MRLEISRAALDTIRAEAAASPAVEVCGLLLGEQDRVTSWRTAANVADDPQRRFEIDPATLFAALRAERNGGAQLVGYWHSHIDGNAAPSRIDAEMAPADGKVWLIIGADVTAWRAIERGGLFDRFDRLDLQIFD